MSNQVEPASPSHPERPPLARPFEMIGIVPAAGYARRLGTSTSSSKELLPISDSKGNSHPVSHFLLRQMQRAGCDRAHIVLRPGKWDIPETLGHVFERGLPLAYNIVRDSWGPPFTIAQALPFARRAGIAIGFPDILIEPANAMAHVVDELFSSQADVVVATFAASQNDGCDLCVANSNNLVTKIVPKEENPTWGAHSQTWLLTAWRPSFNEFFEHTLRTFAAEMALNTPRSKRDLPLGAIMAKALTAGHQIQRVHFPAGRFLDIGSPERLLQASQFFSQPYE